MRLRKYQKEIQEYLVNNIYSKVDQNKAYTDREKVESIRMMRLLDRKKQIDLYKLDSEVEIEEVEIPKFKKEKVKLSTIFRNIITFPIKVTSQLRP